MSNSTNLRPTATITGKVIALIGSDYDFPDRQTGERQQGVSWRLWVAEVNADGNAVTGVHELKVRQVDAPSIERAGLAWDDDVQVYATGFVRVRGQSAEIEWTARMVTKLDTGERVLAAA